MSWDDQLTITDEGKTVGSSAFDKLPAGTQISVRTAAEQDDRQQRQHGHRSADRPGRHARRRTRAGRRGPPRPGQHDAVPDHARTVLDRLGQTGPAGAVEARRSRRPRQLLQGDRVPGPTNRIRLRTHAPARPTAPSGTAAPRTSAACTPRCRRSPSGRRRRSRTSCRRSPASTSTAQQWPYIGAKAGNLPGDLTFSWYAVDRDRAAVGGQPADPTGRASTARATGGWLMTIIKQMFALIPRRRELTAAASDPQRPGLPAKVQHGAADRRNIDAPERFRRRVERDQDRRADHRRVGDGHQSGPAWRSASPASRAPGRSTSTTDSPPCGPRWRR